MNPLKNIFIAVCLSTALCFVVGAADAQPTSPILMVTEAGTATQWQFQCTAQESQDLYNEVVDDLYKAVSDGSLGDPQILHYVLDNERILAADCQALIDILVVDSIDSTSQPVTFPLALPVEDAHTSEAEPVPTNPSSSGTKSGPRYPFRNIFGWEVGSGKITITWGSDGCCNEITGFTFVGSIPLGDCTPSQIGDKAKESCPATEECEEAFRECGHYQFKCQQWFRFRNLGIFTSGVDKICAPCP